MAEIEKDKVFTVRRTSRIFRMVRWMHENPLWVSSDNVGLEGALKISKKPQVSYIKKVVFALLVFYPLFVPFLFPAYIFYVILEIWGHLKREVAQSTGLLLGLFSWSAVLSYAAIIGDRVHGFGERMPFVLNTVQVIAVFMDIFSAILIMVLCIATIEHTFKKCLRIAKKTSIRFTD